MSSTAFHSANNSKVYFCDRVKFADRLWREATREDWIFDRYVRHHDIDDYLIYKLILIPKRRLQI